MACEWVAGIRCKLLKHWWQLDKCPLVEHRAPFSGKVRLPLTYREEQGAVNVIAMLFQVGGLLDY
jgi:hypothetical protein